MNREKRISSRSGTMNPLTNLIRNNTADFINKKYKLTSSENFEAFMAEMKVSAFVNTCGKIIKPILKISCVNDVYSMKTSLLLRTTVIQFKLGQEFIEERADGRRCISVITIKDNIMTHIMKGEPECTVIREFNGDEMIATMTVNNVVAKRIYKTSEATNNKKGQPLRSIPI